MAKYSKRTDAIHVVKVTGAAEAVMFLLEEQLKDAEADVLGAAPADPRVMEKLVRAQTLRGLVERLRSDLK